MPTETPLGSALEELLASGLKLPKVSSQLPPLFLGATAEGEEVLLPGGRSLLLAGRPGCGKSWLVERLVRQAQAQGRPLCVLAPAHPLFGKFSPHPLPPGLQQAGSTGDSLRALARLTPDTLLVVDGLQEFSPAARPFFVPAAQASEEEEGAAERRLIAAARDTLWQQVLLLSLVSGVQLVLSSTAWRSSCLALPPLQEAAHLLFKHPTYSAGQSLFFREKTTLQALSGKAHSLRPTKLLQLDPTHQALVEF